MAQYPSGNGVDIMRCDSRGDDAVVERIMEYPKTYIERPIVSNTQAHYRSDCMEGLEHPLSIERLRYTLVVVHVEDIEPSTVGTARDNLRDRKFDHNEVSLFKAVQRLDKVQWAIDNSFDGLYIHRQDDPSQFKVQFKFAVYMKDEHVTFWKLKYRAHE